MSEKFNYVVGRRWNPDEAEGSVAAYSYGGQVHYGTMEDAEAFRDYCNGTLRPMEWKDGGYRIYKLVEIEK
jgi:hypothetical protein